MLVKKVMQFCTSCYPGSDSSPTKRDTWEVWEISVPWAFEKNVRFTRNNVRGLWYKHARSEGKVYTWNEHIFVCDILVSVEKFHWSSEWVVVRVTLAIVTFVINISVQCVNIVYIVSIVFICDCSYVKHYRTVQTQTFPSTSIHW